ncbi:NUDIX hydrolase [Fulvivirga sp. M361]|uniref:NUDIX hydrolase n=1 Tax=Fulvivirga sp. M361 TaxID=2594266 RepID=UPI00117B969F|nr:NUDIX domain-containing protein [Fulvivirga sp. M361]TRX51302.1 NUDIX hydrolase [Fulvivirga sp. M361]
MKKERFLYKEQTSILIAVDCIVFGFDQNELKLLIFKREVEPLAGKWSLIGSFIKPDESINEAAQRVLSELTDLQNTYMEQLYCFGDINRDAGGRVISVAYWNLMKIDPLNDRIQVRNHTAKWVTLDKVPELVLDHKEMVSRAIQTLKERAQHQPVVFELVPEEFTLPQLLKAYEAVFQKRIDDRNFRKKILGSGLLKATDKKDKTTSRKGSFMYKLDRNTCKKLLKEGYNFEI